MKYKKEYNKNYVPIRCNKELAQKALDRLNKALKTKMTMSEYGRMAIEGYSLGLLKQKITEIRKKLSTD